MTDSTTQPESPVGGPLSSAEPWETSQPLLIAIFTIAWMGVPALTRLLPGRGELAAG